MRKKVDPMRYFSGSRLTRLPLYKVLAGGLAVVMAASLGVGAMAVGVAGVLPVAQPETHTVAHAAPTFTPRPTRKPTPKPTRKPTPKPTPTAAPIEILLETMVIQQNVGIQLYYIDPNQDPVADNTAVETDAEEPLRLILTGVEGTVLLTDSSGNTTQYAVDTANGTVLASDVAPGDYTVSLAPIEGNYIMPQPQAITVKEKVEYKADLESVKEEIKQSTDVAESAEDTGYNNGASAPIEDEVQDTVTYTESSAEETGSETVYYPKLTQDGYMLLQDGTVTCYRPDYDENGIMVSATRSDAKAQSASEQQGGEQTAEGEDASTPAPATESADGGEGSAPSPEDASGGAEESIAVDMPDKAAPITTVQEGPVDPDQLPPDYTFDPSTWPDGVPLPDTSAQPTQDIPDGGEETPGAETPAPETTAEPSSEPTPTSTPEGQEPSVEPTLAPTPEPTPEGQEPSAEPTLVPTPEPTPEGQVPSDQPSATPDPTYGWPLTIPADELLSYGFDVSTEEQTQIEYSGWQDIDGVTYYYDPETHQPVTGSQVIDGKMYEFDENGALKQTNRGIDVSKYQKDIDWNAVKADGIDWAIIRVGYRGYGSGALVEDSSYRRNIEGAIAAGLRVGVYFYSQAVNEEEAVQEASMVLSLVNGYSLPMGVWFDTEKSAGDGRADSISAAERTACAVAFCETIQNSGYSAGVYSYAGWFYNSLNFANLSKYPIWIAQYRDKLDFKYSYNIWQYSSSGRVNGISTNVDMNIG